MRGTRMMGPLAALFSGAIAGMTTAAVEEMMAGFDWDSIEPSSSIEYTPCYESFQCARLLVPLDWLNPEDNPGEVAIAILTRPADIDHDDPDYGGGILVNPGGPNGSGVGLALRWGHMLQKASDGKKKYDIVGFDPRGVGFSTPNANCHRNRLSRSHVINEFHASGPLAVGSPAVSQHMALAEGRGLLCEHDDQTTNIRRFMSTSSVARDMVQIVDELDKKGLNSGPAGADESDVRDDNLELRSTKDKTPRLQYWGFSYGTVLGRYFAAMFPGRIGRMILEGVEDTPDYFNGTWETNLLDMDSAIQHFYETCFKGGDRCDMYKSSDSGPDDIRNRWESFVESAPENTPYITDDGFYSTIHRADFEGVFLDPVYSPMTKFAPLAKLMAEALDGNYTMLTASLGYPILQNACQADPQIYNWQVEVLAAVACGDAVPQNLTVAEFEDYLGVLAKDSKSMAKHWASIRLECIRWPDSLRPAYRFTGPWTTPEPDSSLVEGIPAAPILFSSAEIDPVTSLRNARWAAADHPGSGILVQDNVGHGTIGTPGKCRDKWINHYLETGEVPQGEEAWCKADCVPFQECPALEAISASALEDITRRTWMPLGLNI